MKSLMVGIKNVLLWSYERGSWQYDILCLLIVATIFLVPSSFFGDRDRLPTEEARVRTETQANTASQYASNAFVTESKRDIGMNELRTFLNTKGKIELINTPREAIVLFLQNQVKQDVTDVSYEPYSNEYGEAGYRVRFR
jgi:hypothetical protein